MTRGLLRTASAFVFVLAVGATARAQGIPILLASGELNYMLAPQVSPTAYQAVVWGDPKTGPHGTMTKVPAGTQIPEHSHSSAHHAVVVSGTVTVKLGDGTTKDLGPGSCVVIPAGVKHTTTCKPGAECVWYSHQPGKADSIPSSPAPAKK